MKKKIFQLILVLLFAMPGVMKAQTVEIDSVTQPPGDILVQVDMLGFTGSNGNVAAITLTIEYDSDLMSFVSIENTNASFTGSWNANYSNDQLIITYLLLTGAGHDIDGKLLDIKFNYLGGFSTDVSFDTIGCEIANNNLQTISSSYVDGYVEQSAAVGTVSMDDLTELIGNTVNMPVTIIGTGFGAVDAITLKVAYDETQLVYAGIVEDAITGVVANAAGGVLTLNWTGTAMNFTTLDTLLNIQFVYHGGNADVEFFPGCEISSALTLLATDYVNGSVEPIPQSSSLTIQSVGGTAGNPVNVPIVADDIPQTVGSIALNISYDNSKLIYTGYTADQLSGWVVNGSVPGVITIAWSNSGGVIIADGNLLTLNFNYSGGIALIEFDPGCELKTNNFVTIPVTFNNGLVGAFTVSGTLDYVNGLVIPNSTVYLKAPADSSILYTTSANASGYYEFPAVIPGTYFLDASTITDAKYSYDLTDAFIIFLGTYGPGLYEKACDVNDDGGIDQTDAFIVFLSWDNGNNNKVPSWLAPDWIFDNLTVTVVNINVTQDFQGICSGDADGNFVPIP